MQKLLFSSVFRRMKRIPKYIVRNIEISSDSDRENSYEENSDEEKFDERNCDKENSEEKKLKKDILIKLLKTLYIFCIHI